MQSEIELVLLVWVAPLQPYPRLFEDGPGATWFRDSVPGIRVLVLRGKTIPIQRRPWNAVRERLRQVGPFPVDAELAGGRTWPVRATDTVLRVGFGSTNIGARVLGTLIKLLARAYILLELAIAQIRQLTVGLPSVTLEGTEVLVDRVQTLSNGQSIQMAAMKFVCDTMKPQAIVTMTTSTYVDQRRLLDWHRASRRRNVDFACMPLIHTGRRLFSGACSYFSDKGAKRMLHAPLIYGGIPNDVAQTRWLRATSTTWEDMPVVALTEEAEPVKCPLCEDPNLVAVRVTSHFNRPIEAARMRAMHHDHTSGSS